MTKNGHERERSTLLHDLGEAIRQRRTERALTHLELSSKAGVSVRFLSEVEAGRGNISVARLHEIALALGTSASDLLADERRASHRRSRPVVALLGLRGAGKSTIGPLLGKRLRVPFFELDALVERAAGHPLPELFELHGEARYRELERAQLRTLLDGHGARGAVIATGGSIVTDEPSFGLLRAHATTVWLQASARSHWDRVVAQGDRRPMANRKDAQAELSALLRQREELYARARISVDTDALGVEGAVDAIARALPPP